MLRVGLTGSIAVGKSFVARVLADLRCHVIDADQIARDVVVPKTLGLSLIVENFGAEVLQADGTLDRKRLGAIVFADAEKRARLNAILHPLITLRQDEALNRFEQVDPRGIAVVDAALLIESDGYKRFDKLVVAWCQPEIQLARLMARDNLTREAALQKIEAQMPQDEKKSYADFLIDTSDDFDATSRQVAEIVVKLRSLAEKL